MSLRSAKPLMRLWRRLRFGSAAPFASRCSSNSGNIRYVRAVHRIDRLVTKIIRERREQGGDRGDLLSILLLGRDEENQSMSERQLRDEVITLLVAGHETTAIALSWTWYLLAHSPDVDAKLAAGLADRAIGNRFASMEMILILATVSATIPIAMARRPAGRAAALDYAPSERWHSGPAGAPRSIVHPASFASMQALHQCGGDARG